MFLAEQRFNQLEQLDIQVLAAAEMAAAGQRYMAIAIGRDNCYVECGRAYIKDGNRASGQGNETSGSAEVSGGLRLGGEANINAKPRGGGEK